MKKRFLSIILALSMLLAFLPAGALPAFAASDPTASDGTYSYSYTENADGTLTITAFLGTAEQLADNDYTVTIPTELGSKSVSVIGQYAFGSGTKYIKDGEIVSIPNEDNHKKVQKVIIPYGILSIEDGAFYNSTSLKEISIADSVTKIGFGAFYSCSALESITIPGSVTSIGSSAFASCTLLENATLSNGIKSTGQGAFRGCKNLSSVSLADTLTSIGSYAFDGCAQLSSISLPDTLTSISAYTFAECDNLASVSLPQNLTSIGDYAFYKCRWKLTGITVPDTVETIGTHAFEYCSELSGIDLTNTAITSISDYAFSCCTSLKNISLPKDLTSIGDYAFSDAGLVAIDLPDTVTSIGKHAFSGCSYLTSVTIPDKITTLSAYSFTGTSSLKSLSLPAGLTKIEEKAFLQSHIRDYEGTTIYYNGNKACLEALIANSNGQLDRPRLNEYGLVYRCNVNFRTQDGDLIKTVPVYSTMDVKQDDIPVNASGTASTWYLDKEMTQSFDPANTNRQITDDLDLYTAWTASAKTGTLTVTNGSFTYEKQDGEEVTGKTGEIPVGTLVTVSFDKDAFADSGLTFDHWDIKGLKDPTAYNKMEKFTFEMPESAVTLEGMSRDSSIDDGPDLLGTAAIIGTAVVGTAILAYQGHQLGTELYLTYLLPSGAVIPQNRIQLAMLLWQDAGDPAPAAEPAYIDIDADDTDAQNAAQWAVENELMELPDADNTPDQFDPCAAVSTVDVIHAWKKAQSVKG